MTKSPSTISISNIFKFRHFNPPYLLNLLLRFQNIVVSIPFNYLQSAKSCIRIFQMISPSNITKHLHFPAFFRKILPWNIRNMPFFRWISPPFPHPFWWVERPGMIFAARPRRWRIRPSNRPVAYTIARRRSWKNGWKFCGSWKNVLYMIL